MSLRDFPRSSVRVLTSLRGGSAPLSVATGRIEALEGVTETLVRIACRGRDAYLEPLYAAGVVTYLPGDDPLLATAPLPDEMCVESDPPTIVPGPTPAEPPPLPEPPPGPEASPPDDDEDEGGGEGTLLGVWQVFMNYTLTPGAGPGGTTVYVGSTTADQLPTVSSGLTSPRQNWVLFRDHKVGIGSEPFPELYQEFFIYRGPDITGENLVICDLPGCVGKQVGFQSPQQAAQVAPESGLTLKIGQYATAGIATEADLEALRPRNPLEATDPFPSRISTLQTQALNLTEITGLEPMVRDEVVTGSLGLGVTAGPQLIRLEFDTGWSSGIGSSNRRRGAVRSLIPGSPGSSLNVNLEEPA